MLYMCTCVHVQHVTHVCHRVRDRCCNPRCMWPGDARDETPTAREREGRDVRPGPRPVGRVL